MESYVESGVEHSDVGKKNYLGRQGMQPFHLTFYAVHIATYLTMMLAQQEFLKFQGPVTILVQSRTDRVADVIPKPDVKDMAITEPESITELENRLQNLIKSNTPVKPKIGWSPAATKVATVVQGGKVELADSDLQEFIRK